MVRNRKNKPEVVRALRLNLLTPTKRKQRLLVDVMDRFRKCCNFHVEMIKEMGTDKAELHRRCYDKAKAAFKLNGCFVQVARDKAVETYKARIANDGGFPRFRKRTLRLNHNTFKIFKGKAGGWFVSITTQSGRVAIPIVAKGPVWEEAKARLKDIKGGEIGVTNGKFWLSLFIKDPVDIMAPESAKHMVAVDRGVNNLATVVVTNRKGRVVFRKFFSGRRLSWKRKHFFEVRKSMQKSGNFRKARSMKNKEERFMQDVDHKVAKEIANIAGRFPDSAVVLEDLTGIRNKTRSTKRQNRRLHNWSFARLGDYITYKSHSEGCPVLTPSAAYTTRYHNHCGSLDTVRDGDLLTCKCCGYVVNADFNGAYNLSLRGWRMLGFNPGVAGRRESGPKRESCKDNVRLPQHSSNSRSPFPLGRG